MVHVANYNIFAHDKSIYYVSVYLQIGWDSKISVVFLKLQKHISAARLTVFETATGIETLV